MHVILGMQQYRPSASGAWSFSWPWCWALALSLYWGKGWC